MILHIAQYPELGRGHLIELEYLKRSENAGEANVRPAVEKAEGQLRRYLADERLGRQYPSVRFTGLVVVFCGEAQRDWWCPRCRF